MSKSIVKVIIKNISDEDAEIEHGTNPAFVLTPGETIEGELTSDFPVIIRKAE